MENLYPLNEGESDGLVIHCSDPRFQDAFHGFIRQELKLERPAVIVLPGSTASFAVQGFLPKPWHTLKNQIELMAEHNKFPRVIIINHDDCKGYAHAAKWLRGLANIDIAQRQHLKLLAEFVRKTYLPGAKFELYQARIVSGQDSKRVKFEKVL